MIQAPHRNISFITVEYGGNAGDKTIRLLRHGAAIDGIAGSADILYTFDKLPAGSVTLQATGYRRHAKMIISP